MNKSNHHVSSIWWFNQRNGDFIPIFIGNEYADHQRVTFEGCVFEDLNFGNYFAAEEDKSVPEFGFYRDYVSNYSDTSTLILATSPSNTLIIRNSVFRNGNDNVIREVWEGRFAD